MDTKHWFRKKSHKGGLEKMVRIAERYLKFELDLWAKRNKPGGGRYTSLRTNTETAHKFTNYEQNYKKWPDYSNGQFDKNFEILTTRITFESERKYYMD